MITISVATLLWISGGFVVLSSVANSLSMDDRSFYRFFVRFMRALTLNAQQFADKELHIQLPTQAGLNPPPAQPTQNQ